jgi:hypothetical protein
VAEVSAQVRKRGIDGVHQVRVAEPTRSSEEPGDARIATLNGLGARAQRYASVEPQHRLRLLPGGTVGR